MENVSYFESLEKDSNKATCFVDAETFQVLYMNPAMNQLHQGEQKEAEINVVFCAIEPVHFRPEEFAERRQGIYHYCGDLTQCFKKDSQGGETLFFAPKQKPWLSHEKAMSECTKILSTASESAQIDALLALLGDFYHCDKSFIFTVNANDNSLCQRFLWSREEVTSQVDMEHPRLVERLLEEAKKNKPHEVILLRSYPELDPDAKEQKTFFQEQGIQNMLLSPILGRDNQVMAFVGVINPLLFQEDSRILSTITHFVEHNFNTNSLIHEMKLMNEVDVLTGFASRTKYADYLMKLPTMPKESLGVVFVNINGLRRTNDVFGYDIGDKQIKASSDLLKKYFTQTFYRISGDEFVCFVLNMSQEEFLNQLERLRIALHAEENPIFSVGHAWKKGSSDVQKLIAEADTMMYINKQDYYYDSHTQSKEVGDHLLRELLGSLEDEEFLVYLQPQIRLEDTSIIGAEALIRKFDKKANKMVFPDQFIPLYEQHSIIRHVDIFVLEQVCQMLVEWGKIGKAIPISVNLSRVTLLEFDIAKTIGKICDKYQVPHELIVVEVTERVGLIENDVESALIDSFKKLGFRISLDDFGCAYSNIVTLVKITVDEIKIDKSLVDDLMTSEKNQIIVGNILNMCNSFKETHTLAEGIEEEAQAEILKDFGCTYGQGYYYSRPIPAKEFYEKYISS